MGLTVYMLLCSDKSYYTGVTSNLEQRLFQHETGYFPGSYTSSRLPVKLVWFNHFAPKMEAIEWEKRIQKWSRKKKEALINEDYNKLQEYARCNNKTSHLLYKKP